MANIFEYAFVSPIKAYPVTATPGVHIDDDWYYKRLFDWQMKVPYRQKVEKTDFLKVQMISSFPDPTFTLYSIKGYPLGAPVAGTLISNDEAGNGVYEFNHGFGAIDPGIYCGYYKATLADKTFAKITEPWHVAVKHRNTGLFRYKNSKNDFGMMFTGRDVDDNPYNPEFSFRCEAAVMDWELKRDRSSYTDQTHNQSTDYALPFRKGKLYIGDKRGVAEYVTDIVGRIMCCDEWYFNDLQLETPDNTDLDYVRAPGYPLVGASIDVVPAKNLSGQQQNDVEIPGGLFAAYDIVTDAFGSFNIPPSEAEVLLENIE